MDLDRVCQLAGRRIDQFEIIRVLGSGGAGAVYLAHDLTLNRQVALKAIPRTEGVLDQFLSKMIMQEARAAARLIHPNVVQIYQIGEALEFRYIAMEYVSGATAFDVAKKYGGRLPEQLCARIMREGADALQLAESFGICHRDIKPANLLLTPAECLKLTDFGLAAHTSSFQADSEYIQGTPRYMSPEQWSGTELSCATDIYSLGCTIYHLLVGAPPYDEKDFRECEKAHCSRPIPNPRVMLRSLHPELARLLMQCMAKRASDRPSASQVIEAIDSLSTTAPSNSRSGSVMEGSFQQHFDIEGQPFSARRDPSQFWRGAPFAAALDDLRARIDQDQQVIVLEGAGGSGRTFVCDMLEQSSSGLQCFRVEPRLLFNEKMLRSLCRERSLEPSVGASVRFLAEAFLSKVLTGATPGTRVLVLIDPLAVVDGELLAEVDSIMTRLRGDRRLTFVLVGAPSLGARLLTEGYSWSCAEPVQLRPLTQAEILDYIGFRMRSVGSDLAVLKLDRATVQLLHMRSAGSPDAINIACHNALSIAALRREARVSFESFRIGMRRKSYLGQQAARELLEAVDAERR